MHWLNGLQSFGIISAFLLTAWQLRQSSRLTRFDIFWRIGDSHRDIWAHALEKPSLGRVLASERDMKADPLQEQERVFLGILIVHVENVYQAIQEGFYTPMSPTEELDIGETFSLPAPGLAWENVRRYYPKGFTEYMEELRRKASITSRQHQNLQEASSEAGAKGKRPDN